MNTNISNITDEQIKRTFRMGCFMGFFYLIAYTQLYTGISGIIAIVSYKNTIGGPQNIYELLLCDTILNIIVSMITLFALNIYRNTFDNAIRNTILWLQICYFVVMIWNAVAYYTLDESTEKYWISAAPHILFFPKYLSLLFIIFWSCMVLGSFDAFPIFFIS
jgi:hypothetical protein